MLETRCELVSKSLKFLLKHHLKLHLYLWSMTYLYFLRKLEGDRCCPVSKLSTPQLSEMTEENQLG